MTTKQKYYINENYIITVTKIMVSKYSMPFCLISQIIHPR